MTFHGADWLVRKERQSEEDCNRLLKALKIKPGQTVCDMGCGNGFYTLRMARLVGDKGRVLAVDIQPEMLSLLDKQVKGKKIKNVEPILSTPVDPNLPEDKVDLILIVDVYHEFCYPEAHAEGDAQEPGAGRPDRAGRIPARRPDGADQAAAQDDARSRS